MSEYQGVNTVKKDRKPITITANAVERIRYLLDQKQHTNLERSEEAIGIRVLIKPCCATTNFRQKTTYNNGMRSKW